MRYDKEKKRGLHKSICTNAPTLYETNIKVTHLSEFIPLNLKDLRQLYNENN